jgi:hypothetical protein
MVARMESIKGKFTNLVCYRLFGVMYWVDMILLGGSLLGYGRNPSIRCSTTSWKRRSR